MGFFEAFMSNKQRVVTGFALLGALLVIGLIDNFFIMWAFLGVVYIVAFSEAQKLFEVKNSSLVLYAMGLWIIAGIYPYGDDLFVLAGVGYAGAVAFNKELKWDNFFPFIYPTAGMLFIFTMYQEYGVYSLLWLLIVVAMTDVGAYTVGKNIGKTPFCETSPNKTMEGVVGGIVVATLSGAFVGLSIVDFSVAFIVSAFVSILSLIHI